MQQKKAHEIFKRRAVWLEEATALRPFRAAKCHISWGRGMRRVSPTRTTDPGQWLPFTGGAQGYGNYTSLWMNHWTETRPAMQYDAAEGNIRKMVSYLDHRIILVVVLFYEGLQYGIWCYNCITLVVCEWKILYVNCPCSNPTMILF